MRLEIDQKSGVPIYLQLKKQIEYQIVSGRLGIGEQLPTVRQLAVDLTINPNTVARVYLELERDGLLSTKQGKGTFVAAWDPPLGYEQERQTVLRETILRAAAEAVASGFSPEEVRQALQDIITHWRDSYYR
jgi:GntR family transcriptional regulator